MKLRSPSDNFSAIEPSGRITSYVFCTSFFARRLNPWNPEVFNILLMPSIVASVLTTCLFKLLISVVIFPSFVLRLFNSVLSAFNSLSALASVSLYSFTASRSTKAKYSHTSLPHFDCWFFLSPTRVLWASIWTFIWSMMLPISSSKESVSSSDATVVGSLTLASILCVLMVIASLKFFTFAWYSSVFSPGRTSSRLLSKVRTKLLISDT